MVSRGVVSCMIYNFVNLDVCFGRNKSGSAMCILRKKVYCHIALCVYCERRCIVIFSASVIVIVFGM